MTLEELLDDLAADTEKYNIALTDSARYSVRTIVETGVATWLHALPADVHDEVMGLVGSYKRQGTLIFLSNLSEEDMSEVKNKFIALCAL